MENEKRYVPKFRETISRSDILKEIEHGYRFGPYYGLIYAFDEYPILETRKAILRRWLDKSIKVRGQEAEWIEQRVFDLAEDVRSHSLWKDLLHWYVFNADTVNVLSGKFDLISRAIEFAIGLTKMSDFARIGGFSHRSDILKIVVARLEHTPSIYQKLNAPSLRSFLEWFLALQYQSKFNTADYEMVDIKRVVRCAVAVEDWSFLPHLEKVLAKVYQDQENRQKERYDFRKEVDVLEVQAFLRETIRFFREKQENEHK